MIVNSTRIVNAYVSYAWKVIWIQNGMDTSGISKSSLEGLEGLFFTADLRTKLLSWVHWKGFTGWVWSFIVWFRPGVRSPVKDIFRGKRAARS
jgi:hypothetical protein